MKTKMSFLSSIASRSIRHPYSISRSVFHPSSISSVKQNYHQLWHKDVGSVMAQSFYPQQLQIRNFASKKHKRIIKMAKGFRGRANRCFKVAINRVEKALQYAYRDRKVRRREMKKLWNERINAGVRQHGISYSRFIHALHKSGVTLDRKVLAELAANEPFSFKAVVDVVRMRATAVMDVVKNSSKDVAGVMKKSSKEVGDVIRKGSKDVAEAARMSS